MKNYQKTSDDFILTPKRNLMLQYSLLGLLVVLAGIAMVVMANIPKLCLYSPIVTRILGIACIIFGGG